MSIVDLRLAQLKFKSSHFNTNGSPKNNVIFFMVLLKPEDKIISQIAVNCLHGKSQSWLEDRVPLGIGLLPLGDHEGRGWRGTFFSWLSLQGQVG